MAPKDKQTEQAWQTWENFVKGGIWAGGTSAVALFLMAVFLT